MSKLIFTIMLTIFGLASCAKPPATPLPQILAEETVSFVSKDEEEEWMIYCGGVWVSKDLVITAYHCANAAMKFEMSPADKMMAELSGTYPSVLGTVMQFSDKDGFDVLEKGSSRHYKSTVVAVDKEHDLALVKAAHYPSHRIGIVAASLPEIGEEVKVMGHPAGLPYSYTHGYVSAFRSDINQEAVDIKGPFLQITATIVGGNSGGGVFNSSGQLIGIVSFCKNNAMGQGFAIPVSSIKKLIEEYNKTRKDKKSH